MKIGIDARLWNETGVGRYIRNLVWELETIDKENNYVLFVSKGIKKEDLKLKNNWKIVETDIRWHSLKEQLQFANVLKSEQLDMVHFPYFSVPILYNRPYVITIHDLIINHYPTGKASTLPLPMYYLKLLSYKFIIKRAAKKAQKVITVSDTTKSEIEKHLHISPDKINVTYEGMDFPIEGTGENIKSTIKKPYFLYVGNAYPHKNLDRLIDAFSQVIDTYVLNNSNSDVKNISLVLVGKDDYFYRKLKERVTLLGLDKYIFFTGFIPDDELYYYYKNATATILPSRMEGFGLPGLEAMQANCLVLASDIPVFKEIYNDAAVYFDPLEVDSMRDTILKVLTNNEEYSSYKDKGKLRVSHFSWKKMAKETLEIYQNFQ